MMDSRGWEMLSLFHRFAHVFPDNVFGVELAMALEGFSDGIPEALAEDMAVLFPAIERAYQEAQAEKRKRDKGNQGGEDDRFRPGR